MDGRGEKLEIVFWKETLFIDETDKLTPGDHIAVPLEIPGIDFLHHGIYLGTNDFGQEMVADIPGATGPREVTLLHFTNGGSKPITRFNYENGGQSFRNSLLTAKCFIADPQSWGRFSLTKRNCEHFATRCRTGNMFSLQMERQIKKMAVNPFHALRTAGGFLYFHVRHLFH